MQRDTLAIVSFATRPELRAWLQRQPPGGPAVWVRLAKAGSGIPSVTFHDLLEEGLCSAGVSRPDGPATTAPSLQYFGPRRLRGTTSERDRRLVARLRSEGLMNEAGERALR